MEDVNIDKLLIARSTPLEEVEDDLDEDLASEAIEDSIIFDIINSIGTVDFKHTYLSLKNDITILPIDKKIFFAEEIMKTLTKVYGFTFIESENVTTNEEFNMLISFLKWLEYDNEIFTCKFFGFLDVEKIFILDVNKLINDNWNYVYNRVLKFHSTNGNEFLEFFLRTNSKENIQDFLTRIFHLHRYAIVDYLMNKKEK